MFHGEKTIGIASINKTQLSAFPVVLPPLGLQAQFSEHVLAIDSIVGQQTDAMQKARAAFDGLLARAFGVA